MTTITALPTPPSRDDPTNFAARADDFLGALPTFATETNTVAGEVNTAASSASTSASTATTQAGTATTQAGIATTKAAEAAASALTALNAPGTSATSTTSLTVGTGAKSLTIQTGKSIVVGMEVVIAYTTTPTTRMVGTVTAYNSGTGALDVTVSSTSGSGTQAAWTVSLTAAGGVTLAGAETLTNKRITARVGSTTSSATPTINTDLYDIYKLTAQTVDITSMTTNLSGTPTDGQVLIIQITGTAARAITWGASFEASTVALPTTTVTTAMLTVGFLYNSVTSKWRCSGGF
jgi:hypothetical protein